MLTATVNISKKRIWIFISIGLLLVLSLFQLTRYFKEKPTLLSGDNNERRLEFITNKGYSVVDNPVDVKNIIIPEVFSEVYINYNNLQKNSGFNLENYKGKSAVIYSYSLNGYEQDALLHLIVCDGIIIGGDVSSVALNGFMEGL